MEINELNDVNINELYDDAIESAYPTLLVKSYCWSYPISANGGIGYCYECSDSDIVICH